MAGDGHAKPSPVWQMLARQYMYQVLILNLVMCSYVGITSLFDPQRLVMVVYRQDQAASVSANRSVAVESFVPSRLHEDLAASAAPTSIALAFVTARGLWKPLEDKREAILVLVAFHSANLVLLGKQAVESFMVPEIATESTAHTLANSTAEAAEHDAVSSPAEDDAEPDSAQEADLSLADTSGAAADLPRPRRIVITNLVGGILMLALTIGAYYAYRTAAGLGAESGAAAGSATAVQKSKTAKTTKQQ